MDSLTQIMQAIAAVSQKVNDISAKLDDCFNAMHNNSTANIDYIAMMSDIEIPSENRIQEVNK